MKTTLNGLIAVLALGMCIDASADWTSAIGASYISGMNDVTDIMDDNLSTGFVEVDTLTIPIGISYSGYTEWDSGFGAGISVGPIMIGIGDISFFNVPLGADVRYTLKSDGKVRTYVRGGIRYHVASGDFIEGSDPGAFGAIGMEFREKGRSGWGVEVAYDAATIEMEDFSAANRRTDVEPGGLMLSVFVIF